MSVYTIFCVLKLISNSASYIKYANYANWIKKLYITTITCKKRNTIPETKVGFSHRHIIICLLYYYMPTVLVIYVQVTV